MYDEFGRPIAQENPTSVTKEMVLNYFGSGRKSRQIDVMAEEIVALNKRLNDALRDANQYKRYLDHHGGMEAWDRDEIIGRQQLKLDAARAQAARAEEKAHEILAAARMEAEQSISRAKSDAESIRQEAAKHANSVVKNSEASLESLERKIKGLQEELPKLTSEVAVSASALEDFSHPAESYIDLQGDLRELRNEMKLWVTEDMAVTSKDGLPETVAKQRSLLKRVRKLALRAFNEESKQIVKTATASNVEGGLNKIYRSADAIQRLGVDIGLTIDPAYQKLKALELELAVKALSQQKMAREAEREHRAELKEQARIDAELEAQRARLEKEKSHYESILTRVEELGNTERALEIRHQLTEIESGIADVEYRQANQRAGYVYVISNVGAFGDNMVKIGLTRRLEPMDRVRELGDASVPFGFDVHTLFFSEDAVGVESELHKRFAKNRVNRVNLRREFFYASPMQVRDALAEIQGDLLEFVEAPRAEQFNASQEIMRREV